MIKLILLWWVGRKLDAPEWYYMLALIGFFIQTISACGKVKKPPKTINAKGGQFETKEETL